MLVPQTLDGEAEEDEELFDPREELVRELLEYKKFHDAALYLGERYEDRGRRFESGADMLDPGDRPLEEVEVWDLFNAFGALLKAIGAGAVEIASTDVPVSAYMEMVVARLEESGRLAFSDFFSDLQGRVALVGMFLALLELVRLQRIHAVQERDFGDICIELRSCEPAPPETSQNA
jgi:segregation and condensation protein A